MFGLRLRWACQQRRRACLMFVLFGAGYWVMGRVGGLIGDLPHMAAGCAAQDPQTP